MPAAAVIPAPIAYANAVAVKKLVVGFTGGVAQGPAGGRVSLIFPTSRRRATETERPGMRVLLLFPCPWGPTLRG